ncbi:MAG: patatin-like phospholipase family protein [Spirochaetia bacterium]|nr:patatin-like phospholipase family protein [Spirochaetia bacterium]
MSKYKRKHKISLNLGGGAARGLAHIGVIRALNEEKIPYDIVIGISMGAIIGSIYCANPDVNFLEEKSIELIKSEKFKESVIGSWHNDYQKSANNIIKVINKFYKQTGIISKILLSTGILDYDEIDNLLSDYIPDINIEETDFPFVCVAVDLNKGQSDLFQEGSIRDAVYASSSMPLVFAPRVIGNAEYIDGGVLDKLGIDASERLGIPYTIVSDVSNEKIEKKIIRNGLDVMFYMEEIASRYRRKKQLERATVVLNPIHKDIHWSDYSSYREMIDSGYETTKDKIGEIRHKLKTVHPFKKWFFFEHRKLKK